MSNNGILAALRRMGFDRAEMSGHGFRAMARTILDEVLQCRPDFIEHQLGIRSVIRTAALQPDDTPDRTPEDDADMGRLSGWPEGRCKGHPLRRNAGNENAVAAA